MLGPLLLLTALVALPASTANRDQTEHLLRTGRIVSIADIGQGVTESQRVELEGGGRRLRAIFKTVDHSAELEFRFGTETAPAYRDSYKHEIAGYELDKLLGVGLVPAAVERKIDGRRGSLQVWAERVLQIFVHRQPPPDRRYADDQVHTVRLFDYLIFNVDRHFRNLLFGEDWRPILIDQSLAFQQFIKPPRPLHRFPRGPIEKLERLDRRQLNEALGRYLEKDQLQALEERRRVVLELVAAAISERGREEALFAWPPHD
jgi:hypothetical protein